MTFYTNISFLNIRITRYNKGDTAMYQYNFEIFYQNLTCIIQQNWHIHICQLNSKSWAYAGVLTVKSKQHLESDDRQYLYICVHNCKNGPLRRIVLRTNRYVNIERLYKPPLRTSFDLVTFNIIVFIAFIVNYFYFIHGTEMIKEMLVMINDLV